MHCSCTLFPSPPAVLKGHAWMYGEGVEGELANQVHLERPTRICIFVCQYRRKRLAGKACPKMTNYVFSAGMHNFFKAKGRKLEARKSKSGGGAAPSPPAAGGALLTTSVGSGAKPRCKLILVYSGLGNCIWRQLFPLFIPAEMWKWCTLMYFEIHLYFQCA